MIDVLVCTMKFAIRITKMLTSLAILTLVLDGNYGMYVWPCSPVLAQYIWYHRASLKGKTILEIGAGTSLPGIVAAKCEATVILSDSSEYPQCLANCAASCEANNLSNIPVVGSDCFFDTKDFEDIIVTVAFIMKKRPSTEFWCTYQERSSSRSIEYLLMKWGLESTEIDLETFEGDSPTWQDQHYLGIIPFTCSL
ncbi:METTL23 [Mytilus edulis]|uniref:METTL23 n=1 Tax=Mytilus edulis TaxID=6550 RepID=A0A8S3S3S4_MYTED|nr:METTL23 [Mytilus edulis]